jgi:hypothetical protein
LMDQGFAGQHFRAGKSRFAVLSHQAPEGGAAHACERALNDIHWKRGVA